MGKIIAIILLIIGACIIGITNEKDATNALQSIGSTHIHFTGYKLFACSDNDWYHTGFEAINFQGKEIKGVVCSGLFFKNSTIRFN